jgi:hypothetical protein
LLIRFNVGVFVAIFAAKPKVFCSPWQAGYDGSELIFEIRLATVTRKVDGSAAVEHAKAVFRQQRLQYPADIRLDENQRDGSVRRQA